MNNEALLEDSLRMLFTIYQTILKINLTDDTYEEIGENGEFGYFQRMSQWVRGMAKAGMIHEEDLEEYLAFMEMGLLKEHFQNSSECISCRYRLLTEEGFRWVSMELRPSVEYTDDAQIVMLYIRDIHDAYVEEQQHQKELEYYSSRDRLTGCWNRFYYSDFCTSYQERRNRTSGYGIMAADINGLKYTNDRYGHEGGDRLIVSFAQMLVDSFGTKGCCRISGDEFIVLFEDMSEPEVRQRVETFAERLQQQDIPMAAIGYAWELRPLHMNDLLKAAETAMYLDKQNFYRQHQKYLR